MAISPKGGGWLFWHEKAERERSVEPERKAASAAVHPLRLGKQFVQALAESPICDPLLAELIESTRDAIIHVDGSLHIVQFNPAAERMFGLPAADALDQSIAILLPESVRTRYAGRIREFIRNGVSHRHWANFDRIRGRRADGETFPIEVTLFQVTTHGHAGFIALVRDLDRPLGNESARDEDSPRLARFSAIAFEGIVISEQGCIVDCNEQFEKITGFTINELTGRHFQDLIAPEDRNRVMENIRQGREGRAEYALLRKNGERVLVEAHDKMTHGLSPDGTRYSAICAITPDKRSERALQERIARDKLVIAGTRRAVWDWDMLDRRIHFSAQWKALRGLSDNQIGHREAEWGIGIHPQDRVRVGKALQAHLSGKAATYAEEYRIQCPDGTAKWVSDSGMVQRDLDGRAIRMAGSIQDITARKQIDEALRGSQADLNRAQAVGRIGSWRHDIGLNQLYFSEENFRIFGIPKDTPLTYDTFISSVHPDDRQAVSQMWVEPICGKTYDIEHRLIVNGSVKWVRQRAELEFDAHGHVLGGFGTTQDITDIKLAERAWVDADQRKDEFLAMLAHELRNPLAPILNAAHVLGRLQIEEPRLRWAQDVIERQVAHLTRLVDDLLDVSRIVHGKITLKQENIELENWVRQAVGMANPLIDAKGHQIEVTLPEQPVYLLGDRVRLVQVLLNLLDNAVKFTPNDGMIHIDCAVAGSDVMIRVSDNGIGIPAESLPRIFDLFHQGESVEDRSRSGLGIGLTLVKQLIEKHNGQLQAYSDGEGQGAVFIITLPQSDGQVAPACKPDNGS